MIFKKKLIQVLKFERKTIKKFVKIDLLTKKTPSNFTKTSDTSRDSLKLKSEVFKISHNLKALA